MGLNSGTSGDGLDAALVKFDSGMPQILKSKTYYYPKELSKKIIASGEHEFNNGLKWLELDIELGNIMGEFTKKFLSTIKRSGFNADLIASHGQTIRHIPTNKFGPLTYQIGDPSLIARHAGLPVVYDFRKADIAAGGQGAPLSPFLHRHLFQKRTKSIAILNIGGISNITLLPASSSTKKSSASDIGPGNMIIDACMKTLFNKQYDHHGDIASSGIVNNKIVNGFLKRTFFDDAPPKSTGREMFGEKTVRNLLNKMKNDNAENIIATVSEITVKSIHKFVENYGADISSIYLCGGGCKNRYIKNRLTELMPDINIRDTGELGYSPDYLESLLWAYLGYLFIKGKFVDGKMFTGAKKPYIPGRLCLS